MSRDNQYGPWVDGHQIEQGAIAVLQRWLPSAVGEIERQYRLDPGTIDYPVMWETHNVFTEDMEGNMPAGIVVSPGLREPPRREGNGSYTATWGLAIAVINGADDWESTQRLAKCLGAAVRLTVIQNKALHPSVTKVTWLDERYDVMPRALSKRNIMAAQLGFEVEVRDAGNDLSGPLTPTVDPRLPPTPNDPGPWPIAETVEIDTRKRAID